MLNSAPIVRRAVTGVLGAGAVSGAVLFGVLGAAPASAQPAPPPPPPPNCTSADFSGVAAGVSASASAYLFTHPDVNAFFSGLHGAPRAQLEAETAEYFATHPQVQAELTAIRQPLHDLKHRCGFTPADPDGPHF